MQLRALVDSGAELTLINKKIYDSLKYKVPIKRKNIALQSANGSSINALGEIELSFKMGGLKLEHNFIVVSNLNRGVLLGRDFLVKHSARIYFDLGKIRIQNAYIPMEDDTKISSVCRLTKTIT